MAGNDNSNGRSTANKEIGTTLRPENGETTSGGGDDDCANDKPSPPAGESPAPEKATDERGKKGGQQRQHHAGSSFEYEFGGPSGALLTTLFLPVMTLLLAHFASRGRVTLEFLPTVGDLHRQPTTWLTFVCPNCILPPSDDGGGKGGMSYTLLPLVWCFAGVCGWFIFQVFLSVVLPAELVEGTTLRNGRKLTYRINGHLALWVTFLVVQIGWPYLIEDGSRVQFGGAPLTLLYTYYVELAVSAIAFSLLLSIHLYRRSFREYDGDKVKVLLAEGGDSGSPPYDFFMGRELNPRPDSPGSTFDWKEFCELRPGLIGWSLLNAGMAARQREVLGYVSGSMILVNVFQGLYVWDALYQERAILTTMDITTDGFGFMLVFGDLAWVPFTYSLQARYLVDHDPDLPVSALAAVVACNLLGYCIFRGANGQKDAFRRDPDAPGVKHLTYLRTKRGTKLLTSGWWGMARKINYTGDWIMGLSWCLLCGVDSIVPYYYAIYFAILLVHRSVRDDHLCRAKYGEDWDEYRRLVPYRFIPGVI